MKKVLITGGAGFIGFHLAKFLNDKRCHVDLIDDLSRAVKDIELENILKNDNVSLIKLNLLDLDNNLFLKIRDDYDYIYHFAAIVGVNHVTKSPYNVLSKNYSLLDNTLKIGKFQKNLKKFVFASTSEVYSGTLANYGLKFPTSEQTPLAINLLREGRSTYMLSKIYGESMCYHSGLPITIVRPHNFYGPRMGVSHVIPELFKKVVEQKTKELQVFSVNHSRTFCFIEDAINMMYQLAISPNTVNEVYNVGNDDEEIKIGDLANKIINLADKKITVIPKPATKGSPSRRLPSIEKAKKAISYDKQFSLDDGLEVTYNWYMNNVFIDDGVSAI